MILKFQAPVPGEQPNIALGGIATMQMPNGPRVGVIYAELTVTGAAGGAGNVTLPLLTDIAHPTLPAFVKIGGKPCRQRLASELIADNLLQDATAGGSVSYYQGGALVARVNNANNKSSVGLGLAANTATTAVFQVPVYFAEYWRKDVATAEGLALPTAFQGGQFLAPLTIEVPIAVAATTSSVIVVATGLLTGGTVATSGYGCKFWFDYDGLAWPLTNGQPVASIVKKGRFTKGYAVAGDVTVAIPLKDQLMQFSLVLASGDTWSKIVLRKNGTTLKELTPDRLNQTLLDHGMNVAATVPNRIDVVMDLNDDVNAALPLVATDTLEVVATLATVAGAAQMVILTEYYGLPD
jgi:hypothetical protein